MSKSSSKAAAKPKKEASTSAGAASSATSQASMKTSEIRDLIDFIAKSGLNEVDIETKELKLHVKREPDQKVFKSTPVAASVAPTTPAVAQAPLVAATQKAAEAPVASGKKTVEIKSPMIGTFYRSASPESGPFVSVGDKVSKGQTVCMIEAMKLFNEIESEHAGTVVKVMVENSSPVEYDQALFVIELD